MFYITTSRKPVDATRRLARWMALIFGGFSENRGKRSLSEVIERADAEGFTKVLVIYEKYGNPRELSFLNLEGEWLSPVAVIDSAIVPVLEKGRRLTGEFEVKAIGEGAKEFAKLIGEPVFEGNHVVSVVITNSSITFEDDGLPFGPKLGVKFFGKEGGEPKVSPKKTSAKKGE